MAETLKTEEPLKAEEPLARAETVDYRKAFHCFSDWSAPPQFSEVSYLERFGREFWKEQASQIQDRFQALSEELNVVIKEEYEMEDRRSVNKRKTGFYAFRFLYIVAWIILGIVLLHMVLNRVPEDDPEIRFLVWNFVLVFVVGIAGAVCYNCACDGSDVLMLMDGRLQQKAKPTLDQWNSAVSELQVFAEFRLQELDKKKMTMVRISPSLNLWKPGDLEAESLM